jgi:hypothetical protein
VATIARALDMTKQRVDQIVTPIKMYVREKPRLKPGMSKRFRVCRQCGFPYEGFQTHGKARGHNGKFYCSNRCVGLAQRIFSDGDIEALIDLRVEERISWTGLVAVLLPDVVPIQTIQNNIWLYLARRGELTKLNAEKIWQPPLDGKGRWGQWNWLINRTGAQPQ